MNVRSLIFFLVASWLLAISSCGSQTGSTEIEGIIEGKPNAWVLLREPGDNSLSTLDSTRTNEEGVFKFRIVLTETKFLLLQFQEEGEPIVILAEPGEAIYVTAEAGNVARNYRVTGSKGSQLVRTLNFRLNSTVVAIDSLSAYFRRNHEHPNFDSVKHVVDSSYFNLLDDHKNFTVNFIKQNRYSLVAVLALYQQYDSKRWVLNKRDDFSLFQLVDSALNPLYPNNPLVINLHNNVNKMEKQMKLYDKRTEMLEVDEVVPLVSFNLLNGEVRTVKQIWHRYLLVDFWATWCNSCQPISRSYVSVYKKYKPKGFEILQISLDDSREELLKVIERDSLVWFHAFDSLGWGSPMVDSFRINSIPANYLIDRKGVVKAKNVLPNELEQVLSKLLP